MFSFVSNCHLVNLVQKLIIIEIAWCFYLNIKKMTLSLTKPVAGQEFQQFPFPLNFLRKLGRGVVLDWQIFQSLGREKFVDAIFQFFSFGGWLTKTVSSFNYIPRRMERVRLLNIFALERKIDSKSSWEGIIESEIIVLQIWKKSNFILVHIS